MNLEEKKAKYLVLCHAMQAGVAMKINIDNKDTTPKHLRVGINSAMVEHAALVGLLHKKGIITDEEYFDALIEAMEQEVQNYTTMLQEHYGGNIKITLV